MKKLLIILFSYLLITTLLSAQERIILRSNGEQIKISSSKNLREAITETKLTNLKGQIAKSVFPTLRDTDGSNYTVSYRSKGKIFDVNFGFFGQDVMLMWFEAQADMDIKAIGFTCSDDGDQSATVSMRLIRLNWTKKQLQNFNQSTQIGYYPSIGDGFNESDYFGEEATGNWVSKDINNPLPPWTDNADPTANTFEYQLWYPTGFQWPITPVKSDVNNPIYNWLEVDYTTTVKQGDVFAVVVTNDGTTLDGDRIGFWSDNTIGYPGWKYYENGRLETSEPGWWVRKYTWDFAVAVEITGDMPPTFVDVTDLKTTYWENPREVLATIVDGNIVEGGEKGVATATLVYKIDDNEPTEIQMNNLWNNNYSATIPRQFRGAEVEYYIKAIDVNGNESESRLYRYSIFKPTLCENLVILNGYETIEGYPQQYYFYISEENNGNYLYGDYWAYGPVPAELINRYLNVFEITKSGPLDDNSTVVRNWLESSDYNNYFLASDEWLSYRSNGTNTTFQPGSFEYDILGLSEVFNNIAEPDTFSLLYPQEGSVLGDSLYRTMVLNGDESVHYDPITEVGSQNLLDGFSVLSDVEVDMKAKGMDENLYNVGIHRSLSVNGNSIVFLSFNPLTLNNTADISDPNYFWYGAHSSSIQYQTLSNWRGHPDWFDAPMPSVSDVTNLSNTSSTESRIVKAKVTASRPFCTGTLNNVELLYSENDNDFISLEMKYSGNEVYSAEIPGVIGGTKVTYKVKATIETRNENNPYNIDESDEYSYYIESNRDQKTLIIFNGLEATEGYPQSYYFLGLEDSIYQSFDKIAASALSIEVANTYENIFEICSNEPTYDNREIIREWINASSTRNYFLSGQNYFIEQINSSDSTYKAGDFEYDILGITKSRLNINIIDSEQDTITQIIPQQNTELGDALYSQFLNEGYEAVEYRFSLNQIDAFLVAAKNEVFMKAIGKDGAMYNIGTSRILPVGNQIAFISYDPLPVYSKPDDYDFGLSELSPIVQAVYWFRRTTVNVKEENIITNYNISQNYPNPFNPTTIIKYQIPESSFVKLIVYDILGREVTTLVNKEQQAGSYEVEFNANYLASGVYFYSIFAGASTFRQYNASSATTSFVEVKKMLLIK